ncbi:myosin IC heavy chain-like [Amphibalanus amphitrite]|uniref:myosin IC heavy chain-like n=1 Tax=Amphibalanus amphitrite TaxID=1232801 RepID=UPI001C916124|nr:myosin IC heavy chain-like [Amphibalanus amphitrite]
MSGEAQCYCCETGVPPLDRALDELGMLAAVPAGRRQHQAETRRRRRYTVSAGQRPAPPSGSAQIAEQMSRIRLDGAGGASSGGGGGGGPGPGSGFETLYINWDYVSGVGGAPRSPAGGKARRLWSRPAKPYSAGERPAGGRARTTSWGQQEVAALCSAPPPPAPAGAAGERRPAPSRSPAAPAAAPLVRSLSMENLKLGELAGPAAAAVRAGPDVETISRRIEGLRVEYQ